MRIAFINSYGGTMYVDESRAEEYKAAGYMLAANVIDVEAEVVEDVPKRNKRGKRKEE